MKLKTVKYASLSNRGNYENEKIELEAEIADEEDWLAVLNQLKTLVHSQLPGGEDRYWQLYNKIREQERKLEAMNKAIVETARQYEAVTTFMATQGIKTDFPLFPIAELPKLPEAEVIEPEF